MGIFANLEWYEPTQAHKIPHVTTSTSCIPSTGSSTLAHQWIFQSSCLVWQQKEAMWIKIPD